MKIVSSMLALTATAFAAAPAWSVEITRLSGVEFSGAPNVVGAGARAMGMGYAFSAVADDATASTWNPAGMSQLERPEFAFSGALGRVDYGTASDDGDWDADLHSASFIMPFHVAGVQQTLGLSWQRMLDFDATWSSATDSVTNIGAFARLFKDETGTFEREGEFSALGLSYAVEPLLGLSLGVTLNAWDHDLSGASQTESTYSFDTLAITRTLGGALVNTENERTRSTEERTVTGGISTNIGLMWKANPQLTLAFVLRPQFTISQEATWQRVNIDNTTTTRQSGSYSSKIDMPLTATIGTAWRIDDLNTFTVDATWTRWSSYSISENNTVYSAVDPRLRPDQVDDDWALRAGYEHIVIHPRFVSAWRAGVYYEALPAAAPVATLNPKDTVEATAEKYYGFTLGTGFFWRRHIIDFAAEYRRGNEVGAGRITGPNKTTSETRLQGRMNYTFHFLIEIADLGLIMRENEMALALYLASHDHNVAMGVSLMKYICSAICCCGLLTACGGDNAQEVDAASSAPASTQPDERTRDAAALDAIGVDGAKVRAKIDAAIHAEEDRRQQAADEAGE